MRVDVALRVPVKEHVSEGVTVREDVAVDDLEEVFDEVTDGDVVFDGVAELLGVPVREPVWVGLGVPLCVGLGVPVCVKLDVPVWDELAVLVCVDEAVLVAVGEILADMVAVEDGVHGKIWLKYRGIDCAAATLSHKGPMRTPELAKLFGISCVTFAISTQSV